MTVAGPKGIRNSLLEVGDVIMLNDGEDVYGNLPKSLVYRTAPGDWELTHTILRIGHFGIPAGKYVVCQTKEDGGGDGMDRVTQPDGHHVFCFHAEHRHIHVDFYQTGSFTCVLPNPKVVGKAVQTWTLEE
jgi:hypothetical protein